MRRRKPVTEWRWAAALALATMCPASVRAQVAEGGLAFVETEDGSLVLYRRIDSPGEGDGRARFVRVEGEPAAASGAEVIPVVPRDAVLASVSTTTAEVEIVEAAPLTTTAPAPALPGSEEAVYTMSPRSGERPRFRLGASAVGGGTVGEPEGWLVGAALRVGAQLGPWFAFYYAPTLMYAAFSGRSGGDRDGAFVFWSAFVGEVTLFDLVSIGVGPSVDVYDGCDPQVPASAACSRVDEAFFGVHGRVALNLGGGGPGERGAVSISFEVHPTWFGDEYETVAMLGGIGAELY